MTKETLLKAITDYGRARSSSATLAQRGDPGDICDSHRQDAIAKGAHDIIVDCIERMFDTLEAMTADINRHVGEKAALTADIQRYEQLNMQQAQAIKDCVTDRLKTNGRIAHTLLLPDTGSVTVECTPATYSRIAQALTPLRTAPVKLSKLAPDFTGQALYHLINAVNRSSDATNIMRNALTSACEDGDDI